MKFNNLAMETERGGVGSQWVLSGLPLSEHDTPRPGISSGFTMVEIAICLAIIGFALVAIIGVLPTGMQVQRENREETLINQDGAYFVEAIRSGSLGLDELTNFVTEISVNPFGPNDTVITNTFVCPDSLLFGSNILGALSTPRYSNAVLQCLVPQHPSRVYRTHAKVRSISGAASEKGNLETVTFEYRLTSEITPFYDLPLDIITNLPQYRIQPHLYEMRLTFQWPLMADGSVGNSRKVFRSMLSGRFETNAVGYFFDGGSYRNLAQVPPPNTP